MKKYFKRHRHHLYILTFVLTVLILFLWPVISVIIYPGHTGAKFSLMFGGTVKDKIYTEGIHFLLPWDKIYIYDTRIQEDSQTIDVLTKDGLTIRTEVSIRYHIDKLRLPLLHTFVGPEYKTKMIIPVLTAAVRKTFGSYRPFELYSVARTQIQNEIIVEAIEDISRIPIIVDRIIVKRIFLPEGINQAIENKLVAEQNYLRYEYLIKEAREEYKRKFIEASAVRMFQNKVNEGMTQPFLTFKGIEATKELAQSNNSKMVVIGGKDGLPLILNFDDTAQSPTDAAALKTPQQFSPQTLLNEGVMQPTEQNDGDTAKTEAELLHLDELIKQMPGLENIIPPATRGVVPPTPQETGATAMEKTTPSTN